MNTHHFRSVAIFQVFLCLVLIVQLSGFSRDEPSLVYEEAIHHLVITTTPIDTGEGNNKEMKKEIEKIVQEIHLANGKFLKGITNVIVSKEDIDFLVEGRLGCEGHLLGALTNNTIIIKESGKETNKKTLYHEVGHNVWAQLSEETRGKWPFMAPFVSDYASFDAQEDFAESLSCLMTNFNGCIERLFSEKKLFLEQIY